MRGTSDSEVAMVEVLPLVLAALAVVTTHPEAGASNRTRPAVGRAPHVLLTAIDRPVRATSPDVQQLLARGMRHSRTFADLMASLDISDVIVYVEINRKLPPAIAGRMLFATASQDGPRYLRVQIDGNGSTDMQIAALGHELRHALEVAGAPEVRNEEGLARFYQRVGTRGPVSGSYDTAAAQTTGRRVLFELQGVG
jgi:hypothetical protein